MSLHEQKDEVKKTEDQCVESNDSTTASCSSDGSAGRSNKSLRIAPVTASPIDRRRTSSLVKAGTWTHASCSSVCGCNAGSSTIALDPSKGTWTGTSTIARVATAPPIHRSRRRGIGGWTAEEDELLRQAVETCKGKNWKKIAESLDGRTSVQCLHRWKKVLHPDLIKGPWTKEEDEIIIELVEEYGPVKWSSIADSLPGRIGKQCRERWHNHLNPTINKSPWTREEEYILMKGHQVHGNKWAVLSKLLPGRTDNSIKNHWNSSLKKRAEFYSSTGRLRSAIRAARNRVLDDENELVSSALERIFDPVSQTSSLATDVNNLDEDRNGPITSSGVNEHVSSPQALDSEPLPENSGITLNGEQCMFGNEPGSTAMTSQNCFFTPPPCKNLNTVLRKLSKAARSYQNRPSILRKGPLCRFVVPISATERDEVKEVVDQKVNDGGEDNTRSSDSEDVEYNGTEAYDLSPPYGKKTKGKIVIKSRKLEFEFTSEGEEKKGDDEMK